MSKHDGSPEALITFFISHFGDVQEWEKAIRLKWMLNSAVSTQMDDDYLILKATREKNKIL